MDALEVEDLIRRIIREESTQSKQSVANLADQEFLNIREASKFIKYSVSSLYRKISERAIPFHKVGEKRVAFKPSELIAWVESNRNAKRKAQLNNRKIIGHD